MLTFVYSILIFGIFDKCVLYGLNFTKSIFFVIFAMIFESRPNVGKLVHLKYGSNCKTEEIEIQKKCEMGSEFNCMGNLNYIELTIIIRYSKRLFTDNSENFLYSESDFELNEVELN